MDRIVGLETEYGIHIDGMGPSDWIRESAAVVRHAGGLSFAGWNYREESPRSDIRGFVVDRLSTDPDDARFDDPLASRTSHQDDRSDRVLGNGARFYNDHGHPEYATPECRKLFDLVAHDRAGESIVRAAGDRRSRELGRPIRLFKNNSDFHGASYGSHESYLFDREVPASTLIAGLAPFFASRQIICGAGKSGSEGGGAAHHGFQLSQRADFFSVEASVDTLHNRPLVNTRDEPHAARTRYRRLHVICGDANMSDYAIALKVGTTHLVLRLMEEGLCAPVVLSDPPGAARQISRDLTFTGVVERNAGPPLTAIEIQRLYWREARRRYGGSGTDEGWILEAWGETLDLLESDPAALADRLDWAAKYALLEPFRADAGLQWTDDHIRSLDLAYHDLDPEAGLFYALEQSGRMRRLVCDEEISAAAAEPPQDTRAYIRGTFVQRFPEAIRSIGWNGIAFRYQGEEYQFDMNSLVGENVAVLNGELAKASTLDEWVRVIEQGRGR